jgi:hypothetical protein
MSLATGDYMRDYIQTQVDTLKRLMHATDVHFDLLGVTLTIDGQPLFIPQEALHPMRTLVSEAESSLVSQLRKEMAAERGPY